MRATTQHEFSDEQNQILSKANKIELVSVLHLVSTSILMFIFMGNSQAMRTAWIEDFLSLLPPLSFFISNHFRNKKANLHFPYGFHRVVSFGFFVSSVALLLMGSFLIIESGSKLFKAEHPTIGLFHLWGFDIWLGWVMIVVLLWGTFPSIILGHLKSELAPPIHNKILYTDAMMNKADWETAVATIIGVLGIGFGFWWMDSLAAIFVSYSIFRDGFKQSVDAFTELMNRSPKDLDGHYIRLPREIEKIILQYKGILNAHARMYEHGHVIFADIFVDIDENFSSDADELKEKILLLRKKIQSYDWRIHEVMITFSFPDK